MKNWKAIAGVILVFALGALSGSLVTQNVCGHRFERMLHGGGHDMSQVVVDRLSHRLDLDNTQRAEVSKIVTEAHIEMDSVRKEFQPQIESIMNKSQDKIRSILRPDQREKFEKFVAERKARRADRHR